MKKHVRGLTLIELMVVIAVIAILATIAIVSWGSFIRRSARSDAMATLQDLAVRQERYRLANPEYAKLLTDFDPEIPASSPNGKYTIDIVEASTNSAAFLATATPQGAQVGDECGTFAINQDGPVHTGYADAQCWRR